ncbi:DNA-binding NarL/FixJ family response regulator [Silvimonas terrae]|uniref:DNA-binding NarL/FixJ family response regulator n=1 Tax=Silvimonas terrae TaxID=300266 RepID=A0A840RDH3_9NEIS|nr:response regulator transcription factor [Silvimonas terrae]MBB5190423.1 DNA-binding NarL/FixJ family response regulator [Silvimonas terrae]
MDTRSNINIDIVHADQLISLGLGEVMSRFAEFKYRIRPRLPINQFEPGVSHVIIADYDFALAFVERQKGVSHYPAYAPRVMVLTSRDLEWDVRRAMNVGVHGYMLYGATADELRVAIHRLVDQGIYVCHAVSQNLVNTLGHEALTPREMSVLEQISRGAGNQDIAEALGISVGTVKTHVGAILGKLRANSRTEAASIALARGLVSTTRSQPDKHSRLLPPFSNPALASASAAS